MKPKTTKPGKALPPLPESAYPADAVTLAVLPAPTFTATLATGPDALRFCGRMWQRGIPQPITADIKAAMLARGAEEIGFVLTTIEEN